MRIKRLLYKSINSLKKSYSLDLRALACMRIGIAVLILVDLIVRSLSIKAFFTDEGILPISILKLYNWNEFYFSFHALNGNLWWQIVLFLLNAISAIFLLIGYRTRIFTLICWLLLVSLQNRNPFILQGGDDLLRLLLLWGMFLPWGERYSIQKISNYKTSYFSWANIGYILLTCSVFFFSALLKTSPEWRTEGTALYYALSLDQIRLPLGTFIYQYPMLLKTLTFVVFYTELLAPILIILPFLPSKIRLIGIISIMCLLIGISCTLYVGLFYSIGIVSLIGLLPSSILNYFEKYFYKNKTQFITLNKKLTNTFLIYEIAKTLKNFAAISLLSFCLMLNLSGIKNFPYMIDTNVSKYGSLLRLEQNWGMFSPYVLKDDGYFVYGGLTEKNKMIDVKHEKDSVSFKKPLHVVEEFESDRWRKYSENYVFGNNNYMRPYYCKYLLKKWNIENPTKKINELTIYFMKEISLPNYKTKPIEKNVVCNCNITEIK